MCGKIKKIKAKLRHIKKNLRKRSRRSNFC